MATYNVTFFSAGGKPIEQRIEGVDDMRVMVGDLVLFINADGEPVFGLHSTKLISFQRLNDTP